MREWEQVETHVMAELTRLGKEVQKGNDKLDQIMVDVAALKVKAGIWGLVAGCVPAIGIIIGKLANVLVS